LADESASVPAGLAYPRVVDERMWHQSIDVSLVIRTDFTHPHEWAGIQEAIAEPQTEDGFVAFVMFVDDRAYEGATPSQLLTMVPADVHHAVAFIVDTKALTHPDRPILAVNLYDYVEGLEDQGKGPQYGATFRVVPSEMWSIQNNLCDTYR
jgi:hypothetical protein